MRNVEFRQSQGPNNHRKMIAAGVVALSIIISLVYIYYAPRTYEVSMTLIMRNRQTTQQMLALALDDLGVKGVKHKFNTVIEPGELLKISCRDKFYPGESSDCADALGTILQDMQSRCKETTRNNNIEFSRRQKDEANKIKEEISHLPAKFTLTPTVSQTLKNLKEVAEGKMEPVADWQVTLPQIQEVGVVIKTLENNLQVATELKRQLVRDRALYDSLLKWGREPVNQTITTRVKRVVHYEDSPELIKLKDKKAEIEASRMRLLNRSTSRHPLAIKMSAEIDELQAQINALTRLPNVVEDVQVKTNPEMVKWKKELADIESALQGNNAKLALVNKNVATIVTQLERVITRNLKMDLQDEIAKRQQRLEKIMAEKMDPGFMPFEVYVKNLQPEVVQEPDMVEILLYGTGVGLIGAMFILLTRRRTDFTVTEEEEKPEYPMLGSIPRFDAASVKEGA